jgi:Type IV secretion system pilin
MKDFLYRSLLAIANPFPDVPTGPNSVDSILNIIFGVVGAICVLMVTFGGFKYVMSRGDPAQLAKAKDTIMYAVIGMAIVMFATVIVNFVVTRI